MSLDRIPRDIAIAAGLAADDARQQALTEAEQESREVERARRGLLFATRRAEEEQAAVDHEVEQLSGRFFEPPAPPADPPTTPLPVPPAPDDTPNPADPRTWCWICWLFAVIGGLVGLLVGFKTHSFVTDEVNNWQIVPGTIWVVAITGVFFFLGGLLCSFLRQWRNNRYEDEDLDDGDDDA